MKIKFYKGMAVPILLYGAESWTLRKADVNRITVAETRFLRMVNDTRMLCSEDIAYGENGNFFICWKS